MKEAYYFSHDSNARHDPKCAALINDFGMGGYGLYWMLIETLHEQRDGKIEKFPKLIDGLAFEFKCDSEALRKQIEAMINDYNLLKEDEKYIWSERVFRNLELKNKKYDKKAQAGRIGGLRSGEVRRMKQNEAMLEANELKERKVKESKDIRGRFTPPSHSQIEEYCQSKDFIISIDSFLSFYESNGWRVGKNKMKDWKAAVRGWHFRNNGNTEQKDML